MLHPLRGVYFLFFQGVYSLFSKGVYSLFSLGCLFPVVFSGCLFRSLCVFIPCFLWGFIPCSFWVFIPCSLCVFIPCPLWGVYSLLFQGVYSLFPQGVYSLFSQGVYSLFSQWKCSALTMLLQERSPQPPPGLQSHHFGSYVRELCGFQRFCLTICWEMGLVLRNEIHQFPG